MKGGDLILEVRRGCQAAGSMASHNPREDSEACVMVAQVAHTRPKSGTHACWWEARRARSWLEMLPAVRVRGPGLGSQRPEQLPVPAAPSCCYLALPALWVAPDAGGSGARHTQPCVSVLNS